MRVLHCRMIMTFLTKSSRQDGPKPNCTFSRETVNGKLEVVIMTIREITAGEELYVQYGATFWSREEAKRHKLVL